MFWVSSATRGPCSLTSVHDWPGSRPDRNTVLGSVERPMPVAASHDHRSLRFARAETDRARSTDDARATRRAAAADRLIPDDPFGSYSADRLDR
jgi:hypothetical protein